MNTLHVPATGMQQDLRLPPENVRLWNVATQGRLETPLDSRGLVDLNKLVRLGKQTVTDGYDWSSSLNDVHHLQWPARLYKSESTAHDFRNLMRRQAFIPRQFHNWLHEITLPPALPDEEVMRYSVAAERTARAIASTAQLAMRLTREPAISEAVLMQRLNQEFDNYTLYIQNAREVPVEFQLLKLAEVEAKNIDEMLAANRHLGKIALNHVPIRLKRLTSRRQYESVVD